MESLDIVIFLNLIEKLSVKDILNLCSVSQRCVKFEDIIWSRKLKKDYNIEKDEIIGKPKSHYLGLYGDETGNQKGWFFLFDRDVDDNNKLKFTVKPITKEDVEYDWHFFIPGTEYPKGEKVYIIRVNIYSNNLYDGVCWVQVSKNVKKVKEKVIKGIENGILIEDAEAVFEQIRQIEINSEIIFQSTMMFGFGGDIPHPVKVDIFLFDYTL